MSKIPRRFAPLGKAKQRFNIGDRDLEIRVRDLVPFEERAKDRILRKSDLGRADFVFGFPDSRILKRYMREDLEEEMKRLERAGKIGRKPRIPATSQADYLLELEGYIRNRMNRS